MLGATLKSKIVETKTPDTPVEGGFFEVEVHFKPKELNKHPSPREFVNSLIGAALIHAMKETQIPKEMWGCYFEEVWQKEFNFPAACNMGGNS